ncbi:MAG: hypothetical protein COB41_10765 [Proteobacteria bacterium]|nr:MAG: hypothetical protein COB41_10765 [Pseudomonadota bacterium]
MFEKLLSYAVNQLYSKKISKFELVYLSSKDSDKSEEILNYILSFEKSVSKELLLEVYRDLSFKHSNGSSKYLSYFNKYKGLFNQVETLTKEDIYLFSYTIKQVSDLNRFNKALELCDMIERRISGSEDDEIILESLIIYYWYANLNFKLHNNLDSILYADKTIQLIQESKKDRTSLIDEEGFKSIQEQMDRIKSSTSVGTPVVHMKKYGRNEKVKVRYSDGKIIESKYKKVKADILAEVCEIIS